ncbi:MAG: ATP-binding protein [Fibrobacteraceae bacterium]|nr:ATP-binding protein [Fibrobacteraceae bacterium]
MSTILQLIKSGESDTVEFKKELPEESRKWLRSIVAFANGAGCSLIVGVEDRTKKIVGVREDSIFRQIDRITDVICSSCEPMIVPSVTVQRIEDKCLIVISVPRGMQRPYCQLPIFVSFPIIRTVHN